jgi:transposase
VHKKPTDYKYDHSEVSKALRETTSKKEFQKLLCVWLKMSLGLTAGEIALAVSLSPAYVRRIQSRARRDPYCFFDKPRGGRKREHISYLREAQILSKFSHKARRGFSLDVKQIQRVYELSVGKHVSTSTIYRLIARHGLRRYLPKARSAAHAQQPHAQMVAKMPKMLKIA